MDENERAVAELSETESMLRLRSQVLGRVVTRVGDIVDIFPINFVLDDAGEIVIRTAEGTKLTEMVIGREVLFEVDEFTDDAAWSVVVRGTARLLEAEAEIRAVEALPLKPMVPTLKRNYVRIIPTSITGRAFQRGDEPLRDGVQVYPS